MLSSGDEWQHSQQGNNNAYCQDGPLTWLDWTAPESRSLAAFIDWFTLLFFTGSALIIWIVWLAVSNSRAVSRRGLRMRWRSGPHRRHRSGVVERSK